MKPPLDLRLAPAAVGAWAGGLLGLSGRWPGLILAGVVVVAGVCVRAGARRAVLLSGAFLLLGLLCAQLTVRGAASDVLMEIAQRRGYAVVEVRLTADPQPMAAPFPDQRGASRYRVRTTSISVGLARQASAVQVTVVGPGLAQFRAGQVLRVSGMMRVDDFAVLPAVSMTVRAPPELLSSAPWWQRWASEVRHKLKEIGQRVGGDGGGLLLGLVIGDTSLLTDSLNADARTTGLTHLVAVSGAHFTLLCGCVVVLLRRFGLRLALIAAGVVGAGIILVVGPQPSVLRAAVMGGIGLAGLLAARPRAPLPALFAAIVVLVCLSPQLAQSAGFAMSVLATAGLILLAPSWSARLRQRGLPAAVADLIAMSAAATVMTLPIVVVLAGAIPTTSVLANLAAAPAVAAGLVLGAMTALVAPVAPSLAYLLAQPASWCTGWIARVAHFFAGWPVSSIAWRGDLLGALTLAVILLVLLVLLRRRVFRVAALVVILLAIAVVLPVRVVREVAWPPPGYLVAMCAVGQGDAAVIPTGNDGSAIVVDTGPDPDLIDGCLRRLSVVTVPLIILTHSHADHVGGLAGVLRGRSVGLVWVGSDMTNPSRHAQLVAQAQRSGAASIVAMPGQTAQIDQVAITVIGPKPLRGTTNDANNNSLVVRVESGGYRILLTGDIELPAQYELLRTPETLAADILKVPHHGSATVLAEFFAAVAPSVALIGVGAENSFGHPSARALGYLAKASNPVVLRTDRDGDIAVTAAAEGGLAALGRGG